MFRVITRVTIVVLFFPTVILSGSGAVHPTRTYDDFGDINCEDEMARLDSFAVQLQQVPSATGVIIYYGGATFRGRLPRRGEATARAARMKPYLVNRRGIPAERIVVINGGYQLNWRAQLWIVPSGTPLPTPSSELKIERVKFRKGKAHPREFRCQI